VVFAFGDHLLDIERRELRLGPDLIGLQPQVFDMLAYLVRHRERVVSQEELRQAVWRGRIISYSALASRINAVRRALGDDGTQQRLVRTFARKGFRFVGEASELPARPTPDPPNAGRSQEPTRVALALPDKPSIAVLPFKNMSGDPEREYFADGVVEEIITALSRITWLFVIARNSTFSYKGQNPDVKEVGRELGVRYVLEGSVRKAAGRVRIAAQLLEAETGAHLWADRFDGSLQDVFDLQDRVASSVAGVVEPALQAVETVRSAHRPTNDLTAYDAYLRAYAMYHASATQIPQALVLLEAAIARDPSYGAALAWAALCCMRLRIDGRSKDYDADKEKGIDYARRALRAASDDPGVLANAALALSWANEDLDVVIALVERALALNPSYARGWYISGMLRWLAGELDLAIEHGETALRLGPRGRVGLIHNLLGGALLHAGRFAEALPKLLLAIQDEPDMPTPHRILASCYAHLGRREEARAVMARLRKLTTLTEYPGTEFRNPAYRDLLLSGLRLAATWEG
jgi:TolB-like protein